MIIKRNEFGQIESQHLPPVEQSLLLEVANNGRVRAIDKIDTPLNKHLLPDPLLYIEHLSMTLDPDYVPPKKKNTHHLVFPKRSYLGFGENSVQFKYRENPSLMIDFQVQLHNYGHWVMNQPKMQSFELMKQVVDEQDQVDRLFKIAREIITTPRWLDSMSLEGAQLYRTAELHVARRGISDDLFFDTLDDMNDGLVDIMPDRQMLANMGLPAAARYLGARAAARSISLDREALTMVRETSVDNVPLKTYSRL